MTRLLIRSGLLCVGTLLMLGVAPCQPLNPVQVFQGVPTGNCQPSGLAVNALVSGSLYTCFNGTWVASSGGGSGPVVSINTIPISDGTVYVNSSLTQDGTTGQVIPSAGMGSLTDTVAFNAGAPIFDFAAGNAQFLTLTANATATTINAAYPQFIFTRICQDGTGGWAFTWPTGFGEAATVNTTASVCTGQFFYWDGTNARATGPAFFTGTPTLIIGTARAAPSTPSTGQVALWPDSTSKTWQGKGDGGAISGMALAKTAATNQPLLSFDPTSGAYTQGFLGTVNAQAGANYAIVAGDGGKLVTLSNGSAQTPTLPNANTLPAGWHVDVEVTGAGTQTITPATSTIDGAASLALTQNQGARIFSDGTNYFTQRGIGGAGTTYTAGNGIDVTGTVISTKTICHAYSSSDQLAQTVANGIGYFAGNCAIPANTLITVGNTIDIWFQLNETTTGTASPQLGFQVDLCTVSGCGSGTVVNLIPDSAFASSAAISLSNRPIRLNLSGLITAFGTPTSTIMPGGIGMGLTGSSPTPWAGLGLITATGATTFDGTVQQFLSIKQTRTMVTGQTCNLLAIVARVAK